MREFRDVLLSMQDMQGHRALVIAEQGVAADKFDLLGLQHSLGSGRQ